MLQQRIYAYRMKKNVTYRSQQDEIPDIKGRFPEFNTIHLQVLQDVARRLDRVYDSFFRRLGEKNNGSRIKAGFPRFKQMIVRSINSALWSYLPGLLFSS